MKPIERFLRDISRDEDLGSEVAHREDIPSRPGRWGEVPEGLRPEVVASLAGLGIRKLYSHQGEAVSRVLSGEDVVVVTPTASGKTLCYNLPVISRCLTEPAARALYLFPIKALEQDQLGAFRELAAACGAAERVTAEIYDGDTSAHKRGKIRRQPPSVIISNPDMIHLGLLAYHSRWQAFFEGLTYIVLDEVHAYRGVFGSHVAHVLRRLLRVAAFYGARPRIIACSATIANPGELASRLAGREIGVVGESGAPEAGRHFLFVNPRRLSASTAASRLLGQAVRADLATIVFTKARKMTELIHTWTIQHDPKLRKVISAYRAGYLPQERREIEQALFSGMLKGVVSTSALEMGIDIGALDVCILVGYPGAITTTWQRGGRVGRQDRESLIILIAQQDALDQYFMKHPRVFFESGYEPATIDPGNHPILKAHLACAAAEIPLTRDDAYYASRSTPSPLPSSPGGEGEYPLSAPSPHPSPPGGEDKGKGVAEAIAELEREGRLLRAVGEDAWHSSARFPHREVSIRGVGESFIIFEESGGAPSPPPSPLRREGEHPSHRKERCCSPWSLPQPSPPEGERERPHRIPSPHPSPLRGEGEVEKGRRDRVIGSLDGHRVFSEGHPGAIYLHRATQYQVTRLDLEGRNLWARKVSANYYTVPLRRKDTAILAVHRSALVKNFVARYGDLKVTEQVTGYEKKRISSGERLSVHELELPPSSFETVGLWIEMDDFIPRAVAGRGLNFMGGIHALEHASISLSPLFALAERDDIGGISIPCHPQVGKAAVFIYDGYPGGVGLAERCFIRLEELLDRTLSLIGGCDCEKGCPACIYSSKCGNGNVPLDKEAAVTVLSLLLDKPEARDWLEKGTDLFTPEFDEDDFAAQEAVNKSVPFSKGPRIVVLDVETRRSAAEVGGWHNAHLMGLALAVTWDSRTGEYRTWTEGQAGDLIRDLVGADLVVGFNLIGFDYRVLSAYDDGTLERLKTFDILLDLRRRLGYRLSLNHLVEHTLGSVKTADGLQSLEWVRQGRLDLVEEYCRHDVQLTGDLFFHGLREKRLRFATKEGKLMELALDWDLEAILARLR